MATINFYLDSRKLKQNGKATLKLIFRINKTTRTHHLGVDLNTSQWDAKSFKIINHPNKAYLNLHISQIYLDVQERVLIFSRENKKPSIAAIDGFLHNLKNNQDGATGALFMTRFHKFVDEKQTPRTKEIYNSTAKHIQNYCKNWETLQFEDITKEWLLGFDNYLRKSSPARNARNIHFRNIRAVFNAAIDDEITTKYPFRNFKIIHEATRKRSLSVDKLRMLCEANCEPSLVQYRDYFKLIFLLIGINMIDLSVASSIFDGRLEYRRAKTKRNYSIKIEPEAMDIINKYKSEKHFLRYMDTVAKYTSFSARLNKNLKQIIPNDEECANISTYYARHTWATIAASLDIPKETIAAALGHGGNTVTDIYIDFDKSKIDVANRKVIDYVFGSIKKDTPDETIFTD